MSPGVGLRAIFAGLLLVTIGGCAGAPHTTGAGASEAPASVAIEDPKSLIGMDRAGLTSTLGEPRMLRRDAPVEIWQYRSRSCVLDVFLYEAPDGIEAVAHLEARNNLAEAVAIDRCMGSVLKRT